MAPTSGYLQIEGQNPFAVESQAAIEPSCKRRGEIRVCCTLPRNTAFDLTDRNDADEKIGRSLPFNLCCEASMALRLTQLRQDDRIDQEAKGC